jgi:hypothetical protein
MLFINKKKGAIIRQPKIVVLSAESKNYYRVIQKIIKINNSQNTEVDLVKPIRVLSTNTLLNLIIIIILLL